MDCPHLIYFADPMCSWCWGFSPVIEAIVALKGERLPIRLVMGGLRPGTAEAMTAKARGDVRDHWRHVTEASGQPFGASPIDREGFVYDTDPAARAVVLARRRGAAMGLAYLRAAHRAFYLKGRDVVDPEVLADLAGELGLEKATFRVELADEDLKRETWRDYAISQGAGVTGFPTLIVGPNPDATWAMIARGFQPAVHVLASIEEWLAARVETSSA